MEALSRLKATFAIETCIGLFRQLNIKTLGRDSWRGVMRKLRCRVRREPLPKMYALTWVTFLDKRIIGLRNMHDWGAPRPDELASNACRQSGPDRDKTRFFSGSEVTVAWTEAYGQCAWCHSLVSPQVQNWPCWYSPSDRAFKAAARRVMCPATAPLLNPTAAGIPLS